MYVRRIQKVGTSTFMVSLPHEWTDGLGLKRGDAVNLRQDEDGSIRIFLSTNRPPETVCILQADKCTSSESLLQGIIGLYVTGKNMINVTSSRKLSYQHMDEIKTALGKLMGLSVVEEKDNQVKLQCFVTPSRYPVRGLVRRMYVLTSGMFNNVLQILTEGRDDLIRQVSSMEEEVNRIYFLALRQILWAARFIDARKDLGYDLPLPVIGDRTIADCIENIGDRVMEMALLAQGKLGAEFDSKTLGAFLDLREKIQILYDKSIQAVVTLDLEIANSAVKSSHKLADEIASLIEGTFVEKPDMACTLVYRNLRELIRKMLDISSYCKTIAHIALNRAMEKENKVCAWSGATTSVDHEFSQ